MKRRDFLAAAAVAGSSSWFAGTANAWQRVDQRDNGNRGHRGYRNLLILVELNGGNDGLNTVVPFTDPLYYRYRPNIGIHRDAVIPLDERVALHPSLAALMPLWRAQQLAIVQGIGYVQPNRSHFRSLEIWDTASRPDQYLGDGWLTRAFAAHPVPAGFTADALVLSGAAMGPFANGARTLALVNDLHSGEPALKTIFPPGAFGASIRTAMEALATADRARRTPIAAHGVAAIRLTLNGFDTHQRQPDRHAALLVQFADGMVALRDALIELGRWNSTLIVTYSEFGRRVQENASLGTDHGAAAAHFVLGARVRGGLYGDAPRLARVDSNGGLPVAVDFRRLHATVLEYWWGLDAKTVLRQRFEPLPLLRV